VEGFTSFVCLYFLLLKMLKYVTDQQSQHYNHDALNCMFQLVAHGYDDTALQVYRSMYGGPKDKNSNILLRNMVMRGRVSALLCNAA